MSNKHYAVDISLAKITVASKGIGSDWQFECNIAEQISTFSRRIRPGASTSPKLTVYSNIIQAPDDSIISPDVAISITEKDPTFDDTATALISMSVPLIKGKFDFFADAQVAGNGGDKGGQADIQFQFAATVVPLDEEFDIEGQDPFDEESS